MCTPRRHRHQKVIRVSIRQVYLELDFFLITHMRREQQQQQQAFDVKLEL